MRSRGLEFIICLVLIVATAAVFWQVRSHDFVSYDDPSYVTENRYVRPGLTFEGVGWAFGAPREGNWIPLTWLSHMLDVQNHGLNPSGHHTTSLLFHLLNTFLLFMVLRLMTGQLWPAAFVAALFALHPLHVESVAWVAERKDVLSTFFWMLTLWAYFRYGRHHEKGAYGAALVFFLLGLMAKPMLVTLPFVLLLLDFWPLGRFGSVRPYHAASIRGDVSFYSRSEKTSLARLVLEKLPFFALAAIFSAITFQAQRAGGAVASLVEHGWTMRISNALVSYACYLGKTFWPGKLAVFYPMPGAIVSWQVLGAGLTLLGVTLLVIWLRHTRPYLLVGWLWYLGTLVPVIGLVQVGSQSMADRYTYVPLIGLFVMAAWAAGDLLANLRHARAVATLFAGVVLFGLTMATWQQLAYWQNSLTLFGHALKVSANNHTAHNSLGAALVSRGRIEEAKGHYLEALRIKPDYARAHNNLGVVLVRQGSIEEAESHYLDAIRLDPDFGEAHTNLGLALLRRGNLKDAEVRFAEAIRIDPGIAQAHYGLGAVLAQQGRFSRAAGHYLDALRIKPDFAQAHNDLGVALMRQKRPKKALKHFHEALRINPGYTHAHNNLNRCLRLLGRSPKAAPKPTGTSQHISVQCRKKWELKRAGARERPPRGVADI